MTGLLLGPGFADRYAERLARIERGTGIGLDRIVVPADPAARLPADAVARVEIAYFSGDVFPDRSPAFFAAALGAAKLRWLHVFNAGVDHPIFARFLDRGVLLTSSPGSNAVPIAQSAIAGLLALARRFPAFARAQRERRWLAPGTGGTRGTSDERARGAGADIEIDLPPDLDTQTLLVLGLGGIGSEIARLGRALGLRVVGVRRSRPPYAAPVDEWHPPERLPELLPRADWLAIACPLTDATRGWIDARRLALLPDGACVINVGRGEIVDESALTAELASGRLRGAYLDVFQVEPLPEASPLWSLPNVIVTPHASSISAGSQARQAEMFLANLERFARGEPLAGRVDGASLRVARTS
jgi:phosphoglycerate dehydrogenase-like enzyme